MKKIVVIAFTVLAVFLLSTTVLKAEEKIPDIETWSLILGSCEKVIFNDDFQSGLKRCYYLDPMQEQGVGAVSWVFYKDGTEYIFWKGWMLHTNQAQTAHFLDGGVWYITPPRKMSHTMGRFTEMRAFFEKAKSAIKGKLAIGKFTFYAVNERGERMMDKTTTVYLNKNSANEPNPRD